MEHGKKIKNKRRREELRSLIVEAENKSDRDRLIELTREFNELQSRGGNG